MSDEAFVQVATDGSGKKVRNRSVRYPQGVDTSGNAQADVTVYQQVVTLADIDGIALDDPNVLLARIAASLDRNNELLELVLGTLSS